MNESEFSTHTFDQLNAGDETSFEKVVGRYREKLCALVSREMGCRFRGRVDPEEPVQSALRSFFRGIEAGDWIISENGKLWSLLATITRHKMLKRIEHEGCGKRNPDREVSREPDLLVSREPTPDDAAIAVDLIERALEGLVSPDPEILRLQLEGRTRKETAALLGLTEAAVRIKLGRLKARLRRLFEDADD